MTRYLLLGAGVFVAGVTAAVVTEVCTRPADAGLCVECSPTPTGEPYATGEVTPQATATPEIIYIFPQRYDFDDDCAVTVLDLTQQAGDFGARYENWDGWVGEFDAERERLEDHDVDLDAVITILDLTLTARAFGIRYEAPCSPVQDGAAAPTLASLAHLKSG